MFPPGSPICYRYAFLRHLEFLDESEEVYQVLQNCQPACGKHTKGQRGATRGYPFYYHLELLDESEDFVPRSEELLAHRSKGEWGATLKCPN